MKRYLKSKTGFLGIILALFGLSTSACVGLVEYGCPNADYDFKGKVMDESGNPVNGIRVIRKKNDIERDRTQTRPDGTFELVTNDFPGDTFQFVFEDVDGELNGGEFETSVIDVETKDAEYKNPKGNWYHGKAAVNIPDARLLKKKRD